MTETSKIMDVYEINKIYNEKGFDGVISEVEGELEYGTVKKYDNDLVRISTGGWSEDESIVHTLVCLTSIFGMKHYVGYLRGGAFYFHRHMRDSDFEIIKVE